jgi:carboxyl-terminal processing protease
VPETENNTDSQYHQTSSGNPRHKKWPLKKIGATFFAVLIVFSSGVAVGKGETHIKSTDSNGKDVPQLNYNSVNQVYKELQENFDGKLNSSQLLDGLKTGLVDAAGDPYTTYFNQKEAKEFSDELKGSFTGIGAELGTNKDNNIVIVSPLSGYPAEKSGLKPQDIIAAVNGKATSGMSVDSVVKEIRGPENTKVKLTIIRNSGNPFEVVINRVKITVPSVKSSIDGNIGYLKISQFGDDTSSLAQKAAQQFKDKNVKGVVLDLRGNPGGYLQSAVEISSLWLDKGQTVVSERHNGQTTSTEYSKGNNILKGIPTVVLVDGGSASASEITAGALHDNKDAILVGVKTFGKGSVQQVINFGDGSELKVTIAHWYTPSGKNINKQGISPDVKVETNEAAVKTNQDPQKDKAYQILQSKIKG